MEVPAGINATKADVAEARARAQIYAIKVRLLAKMIPPRHPDQWRLAEARTILRELQETVAQIAQLTRTLWEDDVDA